MCTCPVVAEVSAVGAVLVAGVVAVVRVLHLDGVVIVVGVVDVVVVLTVVGVFSVVAVAIVSICICKNVLPQIYRLLVLLLEKKDSLRYPSNYLGKNKDTFWKKCNF